MARPTKNAEKRRSRQVIFRFTDAEYDALCHKAERAGISPNELARKFTRSGGRRLVITTSRQCDPALLKRVEQIGHNLNQLVKKAHIFGNIDPEVAHLCRAVETLINRSIEEEGD